jgi:hypothetical protein
VIKVVTEYFDTLVAAAAINHTVAGNFDGPIYGSKMGLFTNSPTLSRTSVLGDLTVATYTGYALAALTWSAAQRKPDGSIRSETGLVTFQPTDAVTPNTITGYFVQSGTGSHLLWAAIFDSAIPLSDALSALGMIDFFSATNPTPALPEVIR